MAKNDKTTTDEKETNTSRSAPKRKKVYERIREGAIPDYVQEHFAKQGYALKAVRWSLQGNEDYRYLARRENEGYEFVTSDELPEQYLRSIRTIDTKSRQGLVIMGDLCLMKIDLDLRDSRIAAFQEDADREAAAVDIHVLQKKGFRNLGTKSKVMLKEPKFQD